jgi:hypothetical protein
MSYDRTEKLARLLLEGDVSPLVRTVTNAETVSLGPIGGGYAHDFVVGSPFRYEDDVLVIGGFDLGFYEVRLLLLCHPEQSRRVAAALLTNGKAPDRWIPEMELTDTPIKIDNGLVSFSTITALDAIEKKRLRDELLRPLVSSDEPAPAPLWLDLTKNSNIDSVVVSGPKGRASYPVQIGGCRGRACAVLVDFLIPLPD